jgi:phosphoserine phosphatase
MFQVAGQYGIDLSNIIAVGDSEYDICMVRLAGIGVAFCSTNPILNAVAHQRIDLKSFKPILEFAA